MNPGKKGYQRSAGTVMPRDLLRMGPLRGPGDEAVRDDIAAIDRGEGRTLFCYVRSLYGAYPRKFRGYMMDLTSDGIVLRSLLLAHRIQRREDRVRERIVSARVRPFEGTREARRFHTAGLYGPDGRLSWASTTIISSQTTEGVLEFAVKSPDVPLMLHYLARLASVPGS